MGESASNKGGQAWLSPSREGTEDGNGALSATMWH